MKSIKPYIFILFIFIFKVDALFADDITLTINNVEDYAKTDRILTLKFVVQKNTVMIYPDLETTLNIKSLYADGTPLIASRDGGLPIDKDVEQYAEDGAVIEMKTYLPFYKHVNCWVLYTLPENSWKSFTYYIPSCTRQLKIIFNILFPNGQSSEDVTSIIYMQE